DVQTRHSQRSSPNPHHGEFRGVFPSLMLNPSQDYHHLKERRAAIETNGYQGIKAPSSRSTAGGQMIVLFEDQSRNVASIQDYEADFALLTNAGPLTPFTNHATEVLAFTAGAVRSATLPPGVAATYQNWTRISFNR